MNPSGQCTDGTSIRPCASFTSPKHRDQARWKEWRTIAGFKRGVDAAGIFSAEVIKFHGQDWSPLTSYIAAEGATGNDKFPKTKILTLIQRKVEKATGIPPFLGSSSEYDYSLPSSPLLGGGRIIKQMQWAARRETSRQEDRSYSLMGSLQRQLLYCVWRRRRARVSSASSRPFSQRNPLTKCVSSLHGAGAPSLTRYIHRVCCRRDRSVTESPMR